MVSVVSVVKAASIACEKMARIGAGNGVNRTGDIWRGGGKGVSLQAEREIRPLARELKVLRRAKRQSRAES